MYKPEISLIVCTRDRAPQLARTLATLERIEADFPWELIVVDNGSSDSTAEVVGEFGRYFRGRLRIVQEPRPGLARARTAGLAIASGDLIAFTDDDCYPASDWLSRVRECFAANDALGFLGGRILLHDPSDVPVTILLSAEYREFGPRSYLRPGVVQGANMAFRRTALDDVGGFDVRLGPGTPFNCEDIDVVARLSAAGWLGAYDPRPVVHHHHGRKNGEAVRTLRRSYSHGSGAYHAKCLLNPRLRGPYIRQWPRRWWKSPRCMLRELAGAIHYWFTLFVFVSRP